MTLPLNIDWQQILLHVLNFIILAGGLYLLLYKPVKEFMDKRIEHFKGLEQNTEQALKSAEEMKHKYEEQLQNADDEIKQKRIIAQKETDEICAMEIKSAQNQAEKIVTEAKHMAEKEKEEILADAQKEIIGLAAKATEKILLEKTAISAFDQFLEAVEKEARNA